MENTCWICQKNPANTGEHIILKSVLDRLLGKPDNNSKHYLHRIGGNQNLPIKSHKNNNLKFTKSICNVCNNDTTQPYDTAFIDLIDYIVLKKSAIILRGKINLNSISKKSQITKNNLSLYFTKLIGCIIYELGHKELFHHLPRLGRALTEGESFIENIYLGFHRDIKKLATKEGNHIAQLPIADSNFAGIIIDLNWISMTVTFPADTPDSFGKSWQTSNLDTSTIKIGQFEKL